jgi:mRNA interferase MazF
MSKKTGGVNPRRGEVWMANLAPTVGHEQAGTRPALIVSDDALNSSPADLVIVTPVTGTRRGIPAHVPVDPPEGGLAKPSVILGDQVRTVSKHRLVRRLGAVTPATMGLVEECLRFVLAL